MKITTCSIALLVGINLVLIRIETMKKLLGKRKLLFKMDKLKAIDIENAKEEGEQKGKLEEKRQIALNMKNQGLDNEFISKCLNISVDELNKLLDS